MTNAAQVCIPAIRVTLQEVPTIAVPHKHMRRKKTQKYLKESCYHQIKCTATTFLSAFMWRRPLNSAALATTTHRKAEKVSNETGTQVRDQMINKCRIKMDQKELYNVRNPSWKRDQKNKDVVRHCWPTNIFYYSLC